jgi:membrane protease YdiL (CAAX protease family)
MPEDPENLATEASGASGESLPLPPAVLPPLLPRKIWNWRDLLLFVAFLPFALLVSTLAVLVSYVVVRPLAGWHAPVDVAQRNPLFMLVLQCVFYFFILSFLFLLAKLQHQQPFWKSLGWTKPTGRQVAGYLLGGGGLSVGVSLALQLLPDTKEFPLEKLFNSPATAYALGAFAIAVAPVVEELVFRGLLFAILERAAGMHFAVVTTALLFAGLHVQEYWPAWHHMLMILVVGMVFSLARGMTGSLAPSIILHIGFNAFIMTGLFFSTQHFRAVGGFLVR